MIKIKKLTVIVLSVLSAVSALAGCGNKDTESISTENIVKETDLEVEESYREFNIEDFDTVPNILMLYDGDSSNDCDLSENYVVRFHDGVVEEFANATESDDKQIDTWIKYILEDGICADSNNVEVKFIEYAQSSDTTYMYCKINVKSDGEIQNPIFQDWAKDDEIYLIATGGIGNTQSGQAVKITYFIKNFTDNESASETVAENVVEDTTGGETLATDYYSITLPKYWDDKYGYRIIENTAIVGAYNVEIYMNSQNESGEALLFLIDLFEPNDPNVIEAELHYGLNDVGIIQTADGVAYDVAWVYVEDETYTSEESETYRTMSDMIPEIMKTFELVNGTSWWQNTTTPDEKVTMEKPEHYYDVYGDFYKDEVQLVVYVNEDNTIEVEADGEALGKAELINDTGNAYYYEGRNESGTLILSLEYDYQGDTIFIDTAFSESGTDYCGAYYR
jgi:hypothetical protein